MQIMLPYGHAAIAYEAPEARVLVSGIRQGQVCANGIVGTSQGHNVMTQTMIYAALPEFYAILALIASILIG